jgi:hypothetical protein
MREMKNENFFLSNVVKFHRNKFLDSLFKKVDDKNKRRKEHEDERHKAKLLMSGF